MANVAAQFRAGIGPPLPRIVFPEGDDPRVIEAATRAAEQGIARPVLVGPPDATATASEEREIDLDRLTFETVDTDEYAREYSKLRGVSRSTATSMLDDHVVLAALMARLDEVDGVVAGATHSTGEVLSVYNGIIGLEPGCDTASSAIVIETGIPSIGVDGALVYADCAMNVSPSSERLADIALSTAATTRELFDCTPNVAMLSFSTKGSADHERVRTVRRATHMARERIVDGCIEGELQLDAALIPEVQERKLPDSSPCLDEINTLIFPNLDAANIAVKLSEFLAGMNMVGAILQGYSRPVGEISRGTSADTIVEVLAAIALLAKSQPSASRGEILDSRVLRTREEDLDGEVPPR